MMNSVGEKVMMVTLIPHHQTLLRQMIFIIGFLLSTIEQVDRMEGTAPVKSRKPEGKW